MVDNQNPKPFQPDKREIVVFLKRKSKWLKCLILIMVSVAITYIVSHLLCPGSKGEKISNEDVVYFTTIVNTEKNKLEKNITDSLASLDTLASGDTSLKVTQAMKDSVETGLTRESLKSTRERLEAYIVNKYCADSAQLNREMTRILDDKNFEEILLYIPSFNFKVPSFFWLWGEEKYLEVLFFSLFGVLCSLLYFCSEYLRLGLFEIQETPVYWAKLFYAPVITLIIVFGLNQFISAGTKIDDSSYPLLFLSFMLGYFSGRAIELLDRVKDTIIPSKEELKKPSTPPDQTTGTETAASQTANEKFVIEGYVEFEDVNIVMEDKYEAVRIILIDKDNKETEIIPMTPKGYFKFADLTEGTYTIQIKADIDESEYIGKSDSIELTTSKNVVKDVKIILTKK